MNEGEWTDAPAVPSLRGTEPFSGLNATVVDFWAFAMGDLRMNNVRGYLAEFLVRESVGATHPRVEWDTADVIAPDGTRIEVKASAYLQAWAQREPSRIVFSGLRGRMWSPHKGYSSESTYNADVYVFAVQTATSHDRYDPLDTSQWAFWVLPKAVLVQLGIASLSLTRVEQLAERVGYDGLAVEIMTARSR